MQRAHGILEIRSVDDEHRIIEGIANSASVDSYGTVIEPTGAVFNLPIPLFFHDAGSHNHAAPIGEVIATEIRNGLRWFRAQMPKVDDDGTEGGRAVKHRVDAAWTDIKHGLVRGTSIEFLPIEPKSHSAKRWTKWRWVGLAIVPIPSNQDATILAVRTADAAALATPSPGVSGTPRPGVSGNKPTTQRRRPMTIQEQIQQHENSRAAKVARQAALMEAAGTAGETLGEPDAQEYDTLTTEVRSIDEHLVRLGELKRANDSAARPVTPAVPAPRAAGVPIVRVRANTEPGIGMARCAMVLLRNGGNRQEAMEDARRTWPDQAAEMELVLRAPVAAGTTADATWAAPLVQSATLATEFLEFLRPKTLLGRIPGLTKVDFNTRVTSQTGTGTYNWTGEGKPKPLTALAFAAVTLAFNKVTGIIVMTDELVRFSTPSAETRVRDDMTKGIAGFLDNQFLDPAITAVAGVRPASITEGVAGTAASGTTEAAARADIRALLNGFGDLDLSEVVLLMKPGFGFTFGTAVNALGQPAFPGIGIDGGNLLGVPVLTSNATSLATQIVAVHTPSILVADDGGVTIDMSREASLEMESAPTNPVVDTTVLVSLWQHNMLGLRAERPVTWLRARAGSVRRIHTAAYV